MPVIVQIWRLCLVVTVFWSEDYEHWHQLPPSIHPSLSILTHSMPTLRPSCEPPVTLYRHCMNCWYNFHALHIPQRPPLSLHINSLHAYRSSKSIFTFVLRPSCLHIASHHQCTYEFLNTPRPLYISKNGCSRIYFSAPHCCPKIKICSFYYGTSSWNKIKNPTRTRTLDQLSTNLYATAEPPRGPLIPVLKETFKHKVCRYDLTSVSVRSCKIRTSGAL